MILIQEELKIVIIQITFLQEGRLLIALIRLDLMALQMKLIQLQIQEP